MGCFPFCCCFKKIGPKKFAGTAIFCNILKLGIAISSFFLLKFSIVPPALFLNITDLTLTVANIVLLLFVTILLINGKIFDKYNKRGKILCIIAIVFSILIIMSRIATFILVMLNYGNNKKWSKKEKKKRASTLDWLLFFIPCGIFCLLEIIHFLVINYLLKLIKLHSNVSYSEYKKSGQFVGEVSIHGSNTEIKNPQVFPYNNPSTESSM